MGDDNPTKPRPWVIHSPGATHDTYGMVSEYPDELSCGECMKAANVFVVPYRQDVEVAPGVVVRLLSTGDQRLPDNAGFAAGASLQILSPRGDGS
jgi:hypothetical protein